MLFDMECHHPRFLLISKADPSAVAEWRGPSPVSLRTYRLTDKCPKSPCDRHRAICSNLVCEILKGWVTLKCYA